MIDPVEPLQRYWGIEGAGVRPLGGGMNSETWLVTHERATYVAKRVPDAAIADLIAGCDVASALATAGLATGPPVPTNDGRLVVTELGLALLEHVPGRELAGETAEEQRWIGGTLASVHHAGQPTLRPSSATFMTDWLSPDLPGVRDHPWLVRAVEAVRTETGPLAVTWTVLHTDPAPEAFRHDDSTGVTGLIDWAGSVRGPALYDIASAVMYLGGTARAREFLGTYQAEGPLPADEMAHLDAFRRFREAVQGTYFAWRLATNDLTGGIDPSENVQGLSDARRRIAALGLATA